VARFLFYWNNATRIILPSPVAIIPRNLTTELLYFYELFYVMLEQTLDMEVDYQYRKYQ